MISQVKKKDFLPQNDQIWPKIGIFCQFGPGHAGFFGALLVGRLVFVARRLYLGRHLFTLCGYWTPLNLGLLGFFDKRRAGCGGSPVPPPLPGTNPFDGFPSSGAAYPPQQQQQATVRISVDETWFNPSPLTSKLF